MNLELSFLNNISQIASSQPDKIFCHLILRDQTTTITYGNLLREAECYARFLRQRKVPKNELAVIVCDHSLSLIYSFFGVILHGAIPAIFSAPSIKLSAEGFRRALRTLLETNPGCWLLADKGHEEEFHSSIGKMPVSLWSPEIHTNDESPLDLSHISDRERIILLQHSSGTTGAKKGVALNSRQIINQIDNYRIALRLEAQDKIVSWLPLYHDMGLIACLILPVLCEVPVWMMSPFDWVMDPALLFRTISSSRATLCWLPNFAFNFLVQNVDEEQMQGLTLSSMRAFINCSEPIQAKSHDIFYEQFKKYGVRKEMLGTCYAMAENTFAVTQGGIEEPLKVEGRWVSSGSPIRHNSVKIVDPKDQILPERSIGEIMIQSDSLFREYYRRPELTRDILVEEWYKTGDLGYLSQGHLFVTGRKKDLLIVAGKNVYPQDIEEITSRVEGVYPGRIVCFGVENPEKGTEEIIVLAETLLIDESRLAAIKMKIARLINEEMGLTVADIRLLPHSTLIKSTSGKISRSMNRQRYQIDNDRR